MSKLRVLQRLRDSKPESNEAILTEDMISRVFLVVMTKCASFTLGYSAKLPYY